MKRLIKIHLLILLIIISCDKEGRIIPNDTELPPLTTTGENTFGCLMNGEVWTPYIPLSLFPTIRPRLTANYSQESGSLKIDANRIIPEKNIDDWVNLSIDSIFIIGKYFFVNTLYDHHYLPETFLLRNDSLLYCLKNEDVGELEVAKLDTSNDIISGTFNIVIFDTVYLDTITISEGRFDIKYK